MQHVPSDVHTEPDAHWRHVTLPPHPSLTGWHEGLATLEQSSLVQQLFERHVWLAPHPPHWTVCPHPSFRLPQPFVVGHALAEQHVPVVLHTSKPGHTVLVQSSVVLVQGSCFFPQSSGPHVSGVQHVFWSWPPTAPHVSPPVQLLEQL